MKGLKDKFRIPDEIIKWEIYTREKSGKEYMRLAKKMLGESEIISKNMKNMSWIAEVQYKHCPGSKRIIDGDIRPYYSEREESWDVDLIFHPSIKGIIPSIHGGGKSFSSRVECKKYYKYLCKKYGLRTV